MTVVIVNPKCIELTRAALHLPSLKSPTTPVPPRSNLKLVGKAPKRCVKRVRFFDVVDIIIIPEDEYDRTSISTVSHIYHNDYVQFKGKPAAHVITPDALEAFNENNKCCRLGELDVNRVQQQQQHMQQMQEESKWALCLSISQTCGKKRFVKIVKSHQNNLVLGDIMEIDE